MMKIHTTQNLNSLVQNQPSTTSVSSKDFRVKSYSEQMLMPRLSAAAVFDSYHVSFTGKGPKAEDTKKILKGVKKFVGEIKKNPEPMRKKGDEFKKSSLFNWFLSKSEYEPVMQAALAALVCTLLRPATIMAIPNSKKGKQDNAYAASHSIASGIVGLVSTLLLTTPFKAGGKYVMNVALKDLKESTLKQMFPHLDINSIKDAKGIRNSVDKWIDTEGNKFSTNIKNVAQLPIFEQLADVSEKTFKNILKVDVDWAANKGKSFNDVTLKNGKKLYDTIDMSRLGIVVKEDGFNDAQILLQDLDKRYLAKLINDSKDTNWNKLDINSVYEESSGIVKDFRQWKDIEGNAWKLDLDRIFVSSPIETYDHKPRISGAKRFDKKDQEFKFNAYQDNRKDGILGTKITNEMVEEEAVNEGVNKLVTWFPDLAFRIPIASTTIALIPWILKRVFHIEKSAKKPEQVAQTNEKIAESKTSEIKNKSNEVNFKGKPPVNGSNKTWFDKMFEPIAKFLGETYGKMMYESPTIRAMAGWIAKQKGNITAHMATLGSLITSSVYVNRTLNKKDLDPERRRTLAINQVLCFIVPTIAAYLVDSKIGNWVKRQEYRYTSLQKYAEALAEAEGKPFSAEKVAQITRKIKGIRPLASLAVFTLIYRYATPVIITPIANMIGDWVNAKHKQNKTEVNKAV